MSGTLSWMTFEWKTNAKEATYSPFLRNHPYNPKFNYSIYFDPVNVGVYLYVREIAFNFEETIKEVTFKVQMIDDNNQVALEFAGPKKMKQLESEFISDGYYGFENI